MRALMFGGAFNPPTRAHIDLAEYALKQTGRDCVIFVPSKMTYIRDEQNKDYSFSDEERLRMLKSIASKRSWMIVEDWELRRQSQPRTYETLCYLKEKGYECALLFGSDKLTELETGWKHIPEIAAEFGIVCMSRSEDDCRSIISSSAYLRKLESCITIVETPAEYRRISSTEARKIFLAAREEINRLCQVLPAELDGLKEYL